MKLTTHTYQRLLWITASASLLSIVGCSNLPRTASSNDTAKYGTNGRSLDSIIGSSPTAYNALYGPLPRGASTAYSPPSNTTSSSSTASSPTSPGGHSGGTAPSSSTTSSGTSSGGHSGGTTASSSTASSGTSSGGHGSGTTGSSSTASSGTSSGGPSSGK
jgi:hypothetical protein